MDELEKYLTHLLNDEVYFCQTLFDFVAFPGRVEDIVLKQVTSDLSEMRAVLDGRCYSMTKNNEQVAQYKFKISAPGYAEWPIIKRFSDFYELDQQLKIRYRNLADLQRIDKFPQHFPELPPRISAFGIKTSVAYRGPKMVQYLNDVFQLPLIGSFFIFRKFIQLQNQFTEHGNNQASNDVPDISITIEQTKSKNSSMIKDHNGVDLNKIESFNIDELQSGLLRNVNSPKF